MRLLFSTFAKRINQRYGSLRYLQSSASTTTKSSSFGFVFDIDGVIFRGRDLLPGAHEAIDLLTDEKKKFRFPVVFLTNGTHSMRITRAQRLSEALDVEILPSQVVLAHSPLTMFNDFHGKHVLMVGQGPVEEIGANMGFKKITTLEDLGTLFPYLDCVNFKRRRHDFSTVVSTSFQPIEAIVLLGEPLKWESALQYLVDVLITNGNPVEPSITRGSIAHPHLPIIACNLDLLWMAEAQLPLPRFGHGIFLTCLETLYRKLTGYELHYTAILGKPSEVSFLHATYCAQKVAHHLGLSPIEKLYVIGDNPESDILGANLFNRYLQEGGVGRFDHSDLKHLEEETCHYSDVKQVKECIPFLVESGIYNQKCEMNSFIRPVSLMLKELKEQERQILRRPKHVEKNLLSAVQKILKIHNILK
uniref:Cat eye syndrome critical region protein 5 n=1 Tax=Panagrolaimus superbus TaxID=310955 RepID=A0A914YWK2_9BILA